MLESFRFIPYQISSILLKVLFFQTIISIVYSNVYIVTNPVTSFGATIYGIDSYLKIVNRNTCTGSWDCFFTQPCKTFFDNSTNYVNYIAFDRTTVTEDCASIDLITLKYRLNYESRKEFQDIIDTSNLIHSLLIAEISALVIVITITVIVCRYSDKYTIITTLCNTGVTAISCLVYAFLIALMFTARSLINGITSDVDDSIPSFVSLPLYRCIDWLIVTCCFFPFFTIYTFITNIGRNKDRQKEEMQSLLSK